MFEGFTVCKSTVSAIRYLINEQLLIMRHTIDFDGTYGEFNDVEYFSNLEIELVFSEFLILRIHDYYFIKENCWQNRNE